MRGECCSRSRALVRLSDKKVNFVVIPVIAHTRTLSSQVVSQAMRGGGRGNGTMTFDNTTTEKTTVSHGGKYFGCLALEMFWLCPAAHLNKGFACEMSYDVSALTLIYCPLLNSYQRRFSVSVQLLMAQFAIGSPLHHLELTICPIALSSR